LPSSWRCLAPGQGDAIPDAPVTREDPDAVTQATGGGHFEHAEPGKAPFSLRWGGRHLTFADGRSKVDGGVELRSQSRGKNFTATAKEADVIVKDRVLKVGRFTNDVKLTTEDGLSVAAGSEAAYDDADGIWRIPGAVAFTKGRLKGTGVGATYDQNNDVLWLLDKAHISVAPDETGGGRLEADARTAGMARAEHYIRLSGDGRIDAEGRIVRGDEIVIKLTEDDKRVQMLEQRGHSRIDGGTGGPQSMAANDIDLTYGEDGRSLQLARLMENASVQLPGTGQSPGRHVTGERSTSRSLRTERR
jgi:hypothetical protein